MRRSLKAFLILVVIALSNVPAQENAPKTKEETKPQNEVGEEVINLQSEMLLKDLVETVSELTGEVFILDEGVKAKRVVIVTPKGGFKRQNARRLFEAILDLNGFTMVKGDGLNKIILKRDVKTYDIPTDVGTRYGPESDIFITKLIQLKYVDALDVVNVLKPLISKEGDMLAYVPANSLIIIDTSSNTNRMLSIINNIDIELVKPQIEFIKLVHAEAVEVAQKIQEIMATVAPSLTPQAVQTTTQRRRRTRVPTQPALRDGSLGAIPKVFPDERTNSLIVIAPRNQMEEIKTLIEKLDTEVSEPEKGIYVVFLRNADAEEVLQILSNLVTDGGGIQTQRGTLGTRRRTTTTTRTPATLVGAAEQQVERRTAAGTTQVPTVEFEEGTRITADPATNSLIIVASRRDYATLKDVIEKLDIRRRQVFVEAAILEVALDKFKALGTTFSFGFTFGEDSENLGFGGTALPGVPSLLGAAASPEGVVSAFGNISGLFLGIIGEEVDPDGDGPIPPIPSFTALFQALASATDVNILSTPSILTTDNEEAEIVVADVIPFPIGTTVGSGGVTTETITRENVGITLRIMPQITEGDYLRLTIHTEVANVKQTPTPGLNTDDFGIATQTRTADSVVVVKDGQTIVIGGLVQDRQSFAENKVPLLGDIPILGYLFKVKSRSMSKINLVIFLTPRIVEAEEDMQKILEEKQRTGIMLQQKGLEKAREEKKESTESILEEKQKTNIMIQKESYEEEEQK